MEKLPDADILWQMDVAFHEAGHALACLLERRSINAWSIRSHPTSARANRRVKKADSSPEGWIYHGGDDEDLFVTMAGGAAEGDDEFIPDDVDPRFIPKMYGKESDQRRAWETVRLMHERLDAQRSSRRIAHSLRKTYEAVFALFGTHDFFHATSAVAGYMFEKGMEIDPNISERMIAFLGTSGITRPVLEKMRRDVLTLNIPGIVRSYAFPNPKKIRS